MDTNTSQLKADIERTREELSETIGAIGDKVSPKQMVRRRTERVKDGLRNAKDAVMGVEERMADRVGGLGHGIGERTLDLKDAVGTRAEEFGEQVKHVKELPRGNPLAAGLIAFGVGALAGSVMKPRPKEREAAQALRDKMQPITGEIAQAGRSIAEGAKEAALEAADELKSKMADAAFSVTDEARARGGDLLDEAKLAGEEIRTSR